MRRFKLLASTVTILMLGIAPTASFLVLRSIEDEDLSSLRSLEEVTPVIMEISSATFTGTTAAEVRLTWSAPVEMIASTTYPGTVTRVTVPEDWSDGRELFAVNGLAVIGFAAPAPLHRDLRWGDDGSDVRELQSFLSRLDLLSDESIDGSFGRAEYDAVVEFNRIRGVDNPAGVVERFSIFWIPTDQAPLVSTSIRVGAVAPSQGDAVAISAPELTAAELELLDTGDVRVPLIRKMRWFFSGSGIAIDLPAGFDLGNDSVILAEIESQFAESGTDTLSIDSLVGVVQLREALVLPKIPGSAVVSGDDPDVLCVVGPSLDSHPTSVSIVQADLGGTLVAAVNAGSEVPQQVVANPRAFGLTCDV